MYVVCIAFDAFVVMCINVQNEIISKFYRPRAQMKDQFVVLMQKLTQVNVLPGLIMLPLTTKDAVKLLVTQWLVEIVTQGAMEYSAQ